MDLHREHKKIKYRKSNDEVIGNVVLRMLKAYGIEKKYYAARAKQIWFETMGETITKYTDNIYVKRNKLFINISSSSLRQEISYSKEKIKNIINEELDVFFIKDVVIW